MRSTSRSGSPRQRDRQRLEEKLFNISLKDFIDEVFESVYRKPFLWYPYCEVLVENLERIAAGLQPRTIVRIPRRSGKSTIILNIFPAWIALGFPGKQIGLTSYSGDRAELQSEQAKKICEAAGSVLDKNHQAKSDWMTNQGSRMWAIGLEDRQADRVGGVVPTPSQNRTVSLSKSMSSNDSRHPSHES